MKNLISLILALCMVLSLTACGAAPAATETPSENQGSTETAAPADNGFKEVDDEDLPF